MSSPEEDGASYFSMGDGSKAPVQVEGGDEESDFRRSQQCSLPHIPHSMVHGRSPIIKHTDNTEGEDKGTLHEVYHVVSGDKVTTIPEHLYRHPSDEEIDGFTSIVKSKIEEACSKFPTANGLCIAFSCEVGCEFTVTVQNIHNSSETVCKAFSNLGYATLTFRNSHKVELLAVFKAVANMALPDSYKAIFLYYTGHGQKYHINTKDGYISINNLKDQFSVHKAPSIRDIVKVLIFDCCRTNAVVKSVSQSPSVDNLIVFYTTPLYQQSFVLNEAGMSVATIELVRLLQRDRSCTLTKLLSVDLCREVKRASGGNLRTDFEGSLDHTVDLFEDKMKAMSPRNVELTEDDDRDVCTIKWEEPIHVKHYIFLGYSIMCKSRGQYQLQGDKWETLKGGTDIGADATSVELPRCNLYGKCLTVMAKYSEVDVNAEEYGDSLAVCMKSESISPGEVHLTVTDIGDGVLTWSRDVCGDELEHITIQRREHSTSREDPDEGWVDVTSRVPVEGQCYPFIDRRLGKFDYRMRLHVNGMSSEWVPAQKCGSPGCCKCRLYVPYLVIALVSFFTIVFCSVSLGAMYGGFTYAVPHPTLLAMAGDTIDCDKLSSNFKKFLSEISLNQEATDKVNDNPNGLSMKVKSFKRTDILSNRQVLHYSGTTDITLNKKYNNILIPDVYYSYPPYIWEGSNISVQVNLSGYTTPPKQLTMYLIYGDLNYNWLEENPSSTPRYEQKFNLFGWDSKTYRMTVRESGYYYIVVRIDPDDSIHLSAYVNFEFYSVSNLSLSDAHKLSSVRDKLTLPLDYHNEEIVVCAVDSQTDFSAYTIHLHLNYSVRGAMAYTIPLIILFVPLVITLLFGVYKFVLCRSRRRHYVRLPDTPHNTINS